MRSVKESIGRWNRKWTAKMAKINEGRTKRRAREGERVSDFVTRKARAPKARAAPKVDQAERKRSTGEDDEVGGTEDFSEPIGCTS
jgi:hypothetical protein